MQAGVYDINIDQGSTWTLQLIWKDDAGIPIDLTNYVARMQVRKDFRSSTTELDLSSPSAGITLGGVAGTIHIVATETETSAIAIDYPTLFLRDGKRVQSMVYDIQLESPVGVSTRILQGTAFVYPEVTR